MSLQNGESSNELKDIYDFIETQNYNFERCSWFSDIWFPLFEQNDILVTNNILIFLYGGGDVALGNDEKFRQYEMEFKSFLKMNNIDFYEAEYHEDILEEYEVLKNEIEHFSTNDLVDKTWLVLKSENFEKAVMYMNNLHSKFIKDYFMTLKKIYNDYIKYIHEHDLIIERIKNLELSRINANMDVFVQNVKAKTMNGYIYIATSLRYAKENKFKIGITESLKARLSQFNNTRCKDDSFYYCYFEKGYNIKNIEKIIHDVLCEFKDAKDKEIFVLHYTVLFEVVKMVIKNINEPYEYINQIITKRLKDLYNLRPFIPKPLEVNEKKLQLDELRAKIIALLDEYIEKKQRNITRTELLDKLSIEDGDKKKTWSYFKEITNWKNSKKPIIHKNGVITITW